MCEDCVEGCGYGTVCGSVGSHYILLMVQPGSGVSSGLGGSHRTLVVKADFIYGGCFEVGGKSPAREREMLKVLVKTSVS